MTKQDDIIIIIIIIIITDGFNVAKSF